MEGYSVTEAASILGVPTERVWELLARGVLSGAPEGETGMRVYLQPRPAPAPPVPEAARTNGDGGTREPERELSPFRELLTEFRNLTERYGQALLALGESRGEVASLRSRVDLLEARMDLRLPMGSAATTPASGWPAPATEVAPPAPAAPAGPNQDEDDEDRPRRRRGHRRATESFAEALARAEDPTKPELPGAAETAAAMAALREEAATESEHAPEAVLPRELPPAEPMPLPEEPDAAGGEASAPVADALGEEAPPALEAQGQGETAIASAEAEVARAAVVDEAVIAEPEAAPSPDADVEAPTAVAEPGAAPSPDADVEEPTAVAEPEVEAGAAPTWPDEEEAPASAEPMPAGSDEAVPVAEAAEIAAEPLEGAEDLAPEHVEATGDTAADEASPVAASADAEPEPEPIAWDPERYTVEIIEPDWYAEEEAEPISAAPTATPAPEVEAEPQQPTEAAPELVEAGPPPEPPEPPEPERTSPPEPAPAPDAPMASAPPSVPEPASAPAEETMLWFGQAPPDAAADEGADEIEIVGAAHRSGPAPMPGSRELDDALAALDALSQGGSTAPPEAISDEGWPRTVDAGDRPVDAVATPEPTTRQPTTPQPTTPAEPTAENASSTSSPGLLPSVRPPATSASRAYRRLRRIFPG
jgi:hypothetical protein